MFLYDKNGYKILSADDLTSTELTKAYNISGDVIYKKQNYSRFARNDFCSVTIKNMQGFAIFDDYIFQFRAGATISNRMVVINLRTGTIVQSDIPCVSDHGDSATFSNEYYDVSDDFPLLYVTADTNPAKVYINRVTTTTSELVKTLSFPLDKTGYYAALCFDVDSNVAYMVGYSEQNYQTDDGGANKTVISKWDLSQLTQNQDGTYTPAFISSYERPFIYVMQGQEYHADMIWIASGGSNYNGYIYALDPNNGDLLFTIDTNTTVEVEAVAFISENEMVVGHQGGMYKLYTFSAV